MIGESPKAEGNASATSWAGKKLHKLERGAQEIGHSMRDGVLRSFHLGGRGNDEDEMQIEMGQRDRTTRPTTADTLVADENRGVHHSEELSAQAAISGAESAHTGDTTAAAVPTTSVPAGPPSRKNRNRRRSSSLTRLPSQNRQETSLDGNHHTVNLNLDTDAANKNGDSGIIQDPRRREGRLGLPVFRRTMSSPRLGMGRTPTRPGTAPTSPTTWTTGYPPLPIPSRPGTADSTVSIQHHRLDSIRANGSRPTRDSSPSRSVRFVVGENGGPIGNVVVGASGISTVNGNNRGRKVDVPPPLPQAPILSRSSSFYRERDGNGRTAVDNLIEEGGPDLNVGSGSDSRFASRPPTR